VVQKDVPIYLEGLGTVQALNTVTIRARVDGQLTHIAFTEGQEIKAGEVLATIDPAPFQAALAQAEAKKKQDEALLANSRSDLVRYDEMLERKAIAAQQYETQKALVAQQEAAVSADEAAIQGAKVQLAYTTIASPLSGRVGIRLLDEGNIVHASDSGGLVSIAQIQPIALVFTLPEQNLREIRKQMANGELPVYAINRENGPPLAKGTLAVIDNQIDSTTGTIKLKAVFANADQGLWPGQFVNARLLLTTRKDGIVVPAAVIQRGPNGAYAFVIVKDGGRGEKGGRGKEVAAKSEPSAQSKGEPSKPEERMVEMRPVKVAQIEKGEALIDAGLQAGEQVVLEGQYRLQAHSKVKLAKSAKIEETDDAP